MAVLYRDMLAGVHTEDGGFLCFKCMPEKISHEDVVFWGMLKDGFVVHAECDKCKKEITIDDEPSPEDVREAVKDTSGHGYH